MHVWKVRKTATISKSEVMKFDFGDAGAAGLDMRLGYDFRFLKGKLGHGIVASGVKRIAATDALGAEPGTLHEAVLLDGLQGVVAAARGESA